ncbi:MAG: glycosyltransferase family 39 protein [Ardenticatenia bacterium]|nr:glycosyltransferase family 39 protein [Ardenticatenia bacterium]
METPITRVRDHRKERADGHQEEPLLAPPEPHRDTPALSLETLLWGVVLALAGALRLGDLGRWPLNAGEAETALAALGRALPTPVPVPADVGALAFNLTALSLWLFGPEDGNVRLPAALAGVALIALLWRSRDVLGRGVALGAATLMALSPTLTFFSRQAADVSLATVGALWLVIAVARYARSPSPARAWEVVAALALGLVSGPGFWGVLVAGALYALHARYRYGRYRDREWLRLIALGRRAWPMRYRLLAGLAGTILFLSTAGWTNPTGFAQALELPDRWLRLLMGGSAPPAIPFSAMTLLYEWPVLVWAALGAALWSERRARWTRFLLLWAFVTFLPAALTNTGWTGALAHIVVPLALLGGVALNVLAQEMTASQWDTEGLYTSAGLVILAFAWLNVVAYSLTGTTTSLLLVAAASSWPAACPLWWPPSTASGGRCA